MMGISVPLFLAIASVLLTCSAWTSHEADFEEQSDEKIGSGNTFPGMCKACKWIVKKIRGTLPDGATEDDIKDRLENVCNKAFILKRPCQWLVRMYIGQLTQELSTSDDVRTICVNLKACKPRPPE